MSCTRGWDVLWDSTEKRGDALRGPPQSLDATGHCRMRGRRMNLWGVPIDWSREFADRAIRNITATTRALFLDFLPEGWSVAKMLS